MVSNRLFFSLFRKPLAFLLMLAIVLCLPVSSIVAAGTADVSVLAPESTVEQGEQFTVSIPVVPNNDIAGMQFSMSFDPSLITADTVTEGDLLDQNGAITYFYPGIIDNTAGTITAVYGAITSPGQTVSSAGTFTTITFTAIEGTTGGTSALSLSDVVVGDIGGNSLSLNVVSGSVDIGSCPVLDSIGDRTINEGDLLTFTISATDPDGDTLTYSALSLPSGASFDPDTQIFSWTPDYGQSGTYSNIYFEVSDGNYIDSEYITITVNNVYLTDINEDGSINVLDMISVTQHWSETGSSGWITADINEDGAINVLDVILIGQDWTD